MIDTATRGNPSTDIPVHRVHDLAVVATGVQAKSLSVSPEEASAPVADSAGWSLPIPQGLIRTALGRERIITPYFRTGSLGGVMAHWISSKISFRENSYQIKISRRGHEVLGP
ncbi:hypothetical protein NKR23_g3408 [Pleurostoma richardsiae]|uniref:Uncharacterized protein n=1 Tax=Pleurostoma richardsiae TaxID=41990 RepID=A0AA38RLT8_9PEZI|nr:hypothetical protein NKR23_g3408 [Pleurostoma richardsiae]